MESPTAKLSSPVGRSDRQEAIKHFMDIKSPSKEVSKELARESLIAISYSLPDKVPSSDAAPAVVNGDNGVPVKNGDGTEEYMSELISISDSPSPDVSNSPAAVVNHQG